MTEEGFTPASRVVELFDGTAPGLTQSGGSTGPVYVAGARYESLAEMQEALERGGPAGVIQAGGSYRRVTKRGGVSRYRRTHKGRRRFPRHRRRTVKRKNSRRARR
jgi:hypothetical protein